MKRAWSAFFIIGLFLPPLFAEDEKPKPDIEERIEVIGKVPLYRAMQSISVLDEDQIREFCQDGLSGLLNQSPGMLVLNAGNPAQFSYGFARGASVNQMLYLVDGVKLHDPSSSLAGNFSFLPPPLIEKIEIVRGPLSSLYGSSAMGGVVNIITRKKEGTLFSFSAGSHGTLESSLHIGRRFGDFFVFADGEALNYDDRLANDRFERRGCSFHSGYERDGLTLGVSFFGALVDAGIPWYMGASTPERRYEQDNFLVTVPLSLRLNHRSHFECKGSLHWNRYEFTDPNDTWNPSFSNDSFLAELQAKFSTRLLESLNLVSGCDFSRQKIQNAYNHESLFSGAGTEVLSFYLDLQADLAQWLLAGSLRYDKYEGLSGVLSPHLGISYNVNSSLKVRASAAQSFRAPTLPEKLNPSWGNPELQPETGRSIEAGADLFLPSLTCGFTLFASRYENLIGFSPLTSRFANINQAVINGVEMECEWEMLRGFSWRAGYTYLHTRDIQYDRALLRRPGHMLNASLHLQTRNFAFSGELAYVGKRLDYDELLWSVSENSPFSHFNFMLSLPVVKKILLFCRLSNAFNARFEEVLGYPAPLRRVMLGIRYQGAD